MADFKRQQLLAANESAFNDFAESGTPTFTDSLPVFDVQLELTQPAIPDAAVQSRLSHAGLPHPGARSARLTFTTYVIGNMATAASAVTERWQHTLLKRALGATASTTGTTISGAGSTANIINVADASSVAAGEVIRIGAKGDTRGDGQMLAVASVAANAITLLTNAPAAPTTAGETVYAVGVIHHDETASVLTQRFMLLHSDTGAQIAVFGCVPASLQWRIPMSGPSALPTITWTYDCAYWRRVATTFPDSTARADDFCAPVTSGSFFINNVATATRATMTVGEMDLNIKLGYSPIYGGLNTSAGSYQQVSGYVKTGMGATLTIKRPWDTVAETFWDQDNATFTYKHILFTANPVDGRCWGFYMPRVMRSGDRPSHVVEINGQNYVTEMFEAIEGPTTTNELTRSSIRFLWS